MSNWITPGRLSSPATIQIIFVWKVEIIFIIFRETLTELEAHLHKLEEDHRNKQLALALDTRLVTFIISPELSWPLQCPPTNRCMDTRKRLGCHENEISAGYDKTQKLTGILRQNTR